MKQIVSGWLYFLLLLAAGAVQAQNYKFPNVPGNDPSSEVPSAATYPAPPNCTTQTFTTIPVTYSHVCSGDITLSTANSILLLGHDVTVVGSITGAGGCAFTMGDKVKVGGIVFGSTGAIEVGNDFEASRVETSTGNFTGGNDLKIKLNIFTTDGDIKLGERVDVKTGISSTTGDITLGLDSVVWAGGIVSSTGIQNLGINGHFTGGLTSSTGSITLGANGIVDGSVTTSTGNINLGSLVKVNAGDVTASTGIITIGDDTVIDGWIRKGNASLLPAGVDYSIYLGQRVTVNGSFLTSEAITFIGDESVVLGSINNAKTGNVTLAEKVHVGGDITVVTGNIYVGRRSQVEGMTTVETGDVNVADYGRVVSNATTTTGSIAVGKFGQVCGDVTTVTGQITVGDHGRLAHKKVGAVVRVTTGKVSIGAVTFGNSGQVGGNVAVTAGSVIFGDDGWVGGTISVTTADTTKGGVTFKDHGRVKSTISYPAPASANFVVGEDFINPAPDLVIPSDCVEVYPSNPASNFACLESNANKPWVASARMPLFTKLAATGFAFDVVALKSDGSIESDYVISGDDVKTVTVEIVDGSNCATGAIAATQSLTFTGSEAILGRNTSGLITVSNAYANLRCRVTDANETPSVVGCSSDNFAVRPSSATLWTTATAPAPSASSTPAIKAGAAFSLGARTSPSYSGILTLDTAKLTAQDPAVTSKQNGGNIGSLTPPTLTEAVVVNDAKYSEVGFLYLASGAYRDDAFTAVDSAASDCITAAVDATNYLSDALVGVTGKYGCSLGNKDPVSLGRFYPDHFAVTETLFKPACGTTASNSFTYMGQPFNLKATVEAKNAGNGTTQNFSGPYFAMAKVVPQLENDNDGKPLPRLTVPDEVVPAWDSGSYLFSATDFKRSTAPDGAYDNLNIGLQVNSTDAALGTATQPYLINRDMAEDNTTCMADTAGKSDGNCTATKIVTGAKVRYGRIKLSNTYGSERLALKLPVAFEYWTSNGWQKNGLDTCSTSSLSSSNFAFVFSGVTAKTNLVACNTAFTTTTLQNSAPAGSAPNYYLMLSAPGVSNNVSKTGWADITLNLGAVALGTNTTCTTAGSAGGDDLPANMPWLQNIVSGVAVKPSARATFGIFKSPLIYRRENY